MVTLTLAVKLLCSKLSGTRLTLLCDNEATVAVVNSGHSKDSFMQACLRELCFYTALYQLEIRVVHVHGIQNRIPDILSRWKSTSDPEFWFNELTCGRKKMFRIPINDGMFTFDNDW